VPQLSHHAQEFAISSHSLKTSFAITKEDRDVLIPYRQPTPRRLPLLADELSGFETTYPHPACYANPAGEAPRQRYISGEYGPYRVRLAEGAEERELACRLRFKVFNIELQEGLQSSYSTGLDQDQFDLFCDHLIVEDQREDKRERRIVGTYRMQSGRMQSGSTAALNCGFYSAQEFLFTPYEHLRSEILELGRASIDREHRTSEVLTLLWRGIAQYARYHNLRYLIGCSSLTSQDPHAGWSMFKQLGPFLVSPELQTIPTRPFALPPPAATPEIIPKVPKLLRTYIGLGARICGPPAWDREFGTIDLLTLLDLQQIAPAAQTRFMSHGTQ
jgi:putative hemolysin